MIGIYFYLHFAINLNIFAYSIGITFPIFTNITILLDFYNTLIILLKF